MLKETLIQIGFNRNEANVYLVLLELGPRPANIIAREVGLLRTTIYPILKNLVKKSLIGSFIKNGVQYFSANDTNNLLEYIERQRRFLDLKRDFIIDIIPRMEGLRGEAGSGAQPRVHYFEGVAGVETVMKDCLRSCHGGSGGRSGDGDAWPLLCINSPEKWLSSDMQRFIREFTKERILIQKIPMKTLSKDTAEARCFFDEYSGICEGDPACFALSEVRYVTDHESLFDNIVHIYDNKVAIISPMKGVEFGVLIESAEFYKTQKSLFELAWVGALRVNEMGVDGSSDV